MFFSSCKKKTVEIDGSYVLLERRIKNMMFEMTSFGINNYCSSEADFVSSFYYPDILKRFMSRKVFKEGKLLYCVELYFPEQIGVLECSGYFDGLIDSGDWIDTLILQLEEERIASEINLMLEEEADVQNIENQAEEIEKVFSDELQAKELTGKSDYLSFMEYDKEILIPQKTSDGYILIHSSGENVTRNFYDDSFRLVTKETWNIKSANNSQLLLTEEFKYPEHANNVIWKKSIALESETEVTYADDGSVLEKTTYTLYKDKRYRKSKVSYTYTKDKKIEQESSISYYYREDYSKLLESFEKKYVYQYNVDDIPPDFKYYENNVLKMQNKYSSEKGTYTSQIFFDGNMAVKTYYENDIRKKDVYTQNEKVLRVKEYEN